ncbi:cytochrome c oxidase subunit II [Sphingobium sufflavum]|uniref:cytochrome c oxidase subunit II n=1 Tax=Sphingobium sufflavum TaxID=1129547 RepID=UPI001F24A4C9|nr:cytochrome c oxidase subunit II [Sphingobium sufflavum]MCE7798796.1 cytochrome c oxidase subunit II [Sphingobium sufflavum]
MNIAKSIVFAGLLAIGAHGAMAQAPAAEAPVTAAVANEAAPVAAANAAAPAESAKAEAKVAAPEQLKPEPTIGQPQAKELGFQEQVTANGRYALWFHNGILLPLITIISVFVLVLLLYVMFRFRAGRNPVPSKVSHNTAIEVIWTLGPVLILVGVAIPSIDLLAKQFKPAPKEALTVKVTGYQWYWGYEYPDNGIAEYVSNMLPPEKAVANGEPGLLAVDNRLVLPVGRPIKLITTGSDVIHSFSVPALWVKIDAVPGRLNERTFTIDRPGVYYGQCSELCGARHGFMPIAIEALPQDKFAQWVASQGGSVTAKPAEAAAAAN